MSKNEITFKVIEYKPIIPDINDYYYQITCNDTKFKDYIYCSKDNKIKDITNLKKSLKYVIKFMKKGRIYGVGNLIINQELFAKKIKQKNYNNIYLFITENNYKKIFPKVDLSKLSKFQTGITLSIEIDIKYDIKDKEINQKKLKLMRRNFSYQERGNYDYSIKSSNNLTTSTTNINTFNNVNNCYDNDNNTENNININLLSSDKYIATTPPCLLSPNDINCPLSESDLNNNKRKKFIKKFNISFKNNTKKKNKLIENKKYNIFDFRNKINQKSSRNNNNRFLYNKKKLNILITQESSSSKNSNTITQSSIINSVFIEKIEDIDNSNVSNMITLNNNDTIQNIINNKSAYNKDNDNDSFDLYLREIENKKSKLLYEQDRRNKKLFVQEEKYNKLISSVNCYENRNNDIKLVINKLKEKNDLLKYKEEILLERNREIIPIISKIKESKEIESNIINSILSNYKNNSNNKAKSTLENNIEKYDKNLMTKMLKNVIQSNNNADLYLKDEYKAKLKYICDKYNIFGSIIEDVDE